MGTVATLRVVEPDHAVAERALAAGLAALARVDSVASRHRPSPDMAAVNAGQAGRWIPVSRELFGILERAQGHARVSHGAFDPTLLPVLLLWSFDDAPRVPSAEELSLALARTGASRLELDADRPAVRWAAPGMGIDLGAIAKGWGIDRAAEAMRAAGAERGLVEVGGDVRVFGRGPAVRGWRIGIQHPRDPERLCGTVEIEDGAIATSGDYEQWFETSEGRFHHILDPSTGRPAGPAVSATVLTAEAVDADALATAAFVLGMDRGIALLDSLAGVEGVIVEAAEEGLRWRATEGLAGRLEIRLE